MTDITRTLPCRHNNITAYNFDSFIFKSRGKNSISTTFEDKRIVETPRHLFNLNEEETSDQQKNAKYPQYMRVSVEAYYIL